MQKLLLLFVLIMKLEVYAQQRPNIIWIITEDMSPELACYGYPYLQTPNLDKLASEGRLYRNMFATAPVCSPARSAMITGMYQTSIGAQDHRSHRDDGYRLPQDIQPITWHLRRAGYFVTNANINAKGEAIAAGKTDYNFSTGTPVFDGFDYHQRKAGQPFFAQLMIFVTHRGPAWNKEVQQHQPQIDPGTLKLPPYYPNHPVAREDWANYLESIQLMDSYVGNVLKKIDEEGLRDNTVVIFSSDHGRCMIRDKQFLYDGGIQVPCIIRWPGTIAPGSKDTDLHSLIDISASVLKIADARVPGHLDGIPFLPVEERRREYIFAARDRMDETVDKMRAVRNKRFKYIKNYYPERPYMQSNKYKETSYPVWNLLKQLKKENKLNKAQMLFTAGTKPAEELYDIVKDPYELHNLAANPNYKQILKKMQVSLEKIVRTEKP